MSAPNPAADPAADPIQCRSCALLLWLALVPAGLGLALPAAALSLGEAETSSRYGQALRVVVPIELGNEDELTDVRLLQLKLLGPAHYEAVGVAPPDIPTVEMEVRAEQVGGRYQAVITSRRPVREPLLTLFVSARLGASQIIREVPVLLDFQGRPAEPAGAGAAAPPVEATAGVAAIDTRVAPVAAAPPLAAPAATEPAPQRRKRERKPAAAVAPVAAAALAQQRPASYSRFRLDSDFASYRRLALAAPPATAEPVVETAEIIEPPPLATAAETTAMDEPAPVASVAAEETLPGEEAEGSWTPYVIGLLIVGGLVYLVRRRAQVRLPHLNIASLPGRYETRYGEAPESLPLVFPATSPDPVAIPGGARATATTAEPAVVEMMTMPVPPTEPSMVPTPAVSESRESYPNQDLRERASQLSRKLNSDKERRKLELVKAYIDVGRPEAAEKLLLEIEQKHSSSGRPEVVDFEIS